MSRAGADMLSPPKLREIQQQKIELMEKILQNDRLQNQVMAR
jgi:hypothetical protein